MKLTIDVFRDGYYKYFRDGWEETDHPRGQPGNAGQFTSGGVGAKKKATGTTKYEPNERAKASYSAIQKILESIGYEKKNANNFRHHLGQKQLRFGVKANGAITIMPIEKAGGAWKALPLLKNKASLTALLEKWHGKLEGFSPILPEPEAPIQAVKYGGPSDSIAKVLMGSKDLGGPALEQLDKILLYAETVPERADVQYLPPGQPYTDAVNLYLHQLKKENGIEVEAPPKSETAPVAPEEPANKVKHGGYLSKMYAKGLIGGAPAGSGPALEHFDKIRSTKTIPELSSIQYLPPGEPYADAVNFYLHQLKRENGIEVEAPVAPEEPANKVKHGGQLSEKYAKGLIGSKDIGGPALEHFDKILSAKTIPELSSIQYLTPGKPYTYAVNFYLHQLKKENGIEVEAPPTYEVPPETPPDDKLNDTTNESTKKLLDAIQATPWANWTDKDKDKFGEIQEANSKKDLNKIGPIANPSSTGADINKYLSALKADNGLEVKPPPPPSKTYAPKPPPPPSKTYAPKSAHEKAVYAAAKDSPHFESEQTNVGMDADGNKVKAVHVINTSKIENSGYANVSAAMADHDEESNEVGAAMEDYRLKCLTKVEEQFGAKAKAAIESYKGSGYCSINSKLRENKGVPTDTKSKQIQKIIADSAVPADMSLWRGMPIGLKTLTGFDDPALAVGRCFIHPSFTSSSRSKTRAEFFGTKTMLRFHVKAGTPGLVLGHQDQGEKEIVFNTRSMFKVLKVEQEPYKSTSRHIVHVEYIGVAP